MKKLSFSEVSRQPDDRWEIRPVFLLVCLAPWLFMSCAQKPALPKIAIINENPVYMDELDLMGRVALQEDNIKFDSPEGQARYHEIAPNLYQTLINIYVMKYSADQEGIQPSPEELQTEFDQFKKGLQDQGVYDQFLQGLGISEDRLKDSVRDHLAIKKLQEQKLLNTEVQVTEQDIRDYYNQNSKTFSYPNRMRASHIFIQSPKEEGPEKREQARLRAEQLRKMIGDEPAKTFVGLARQYSDDVSTKERGGDLGFFDRNGAGLNDLFKQAAFALKEGEVSGVVETDFGYHIIWATDHEQSLEEAHDGIKDWITKSKKTEKFSKWLEEATKKIPIVKLFDPKEFKVLNKEEVNQQKK